MKPVQDYAEYRRRRKLSNFTQLEIGKRAGIGQSLLSQFEQGRAELAPSKLEKLDAVLEEAIQQRREELGCNIAKNIDLKDQELGILGRGRRAFLRVLLSPIPIALVAAVACDEFIPHHKHLISLIWDPDADQKLLESLFGTVGPSGTGALIAAADHPFKKPAQGDIWYPTEKLNCASYKTRFHENCVLRPVSSDPELMPEDGLVLFGSQVSNYKTRKYFGNFLRPKPLLHLATDHWRVKLHWNLYTPDSAQTMERWQFGADWKTWRHRFGGSRGDEFMSEERDGTLADDYLLVTALPLSGRGRERIVVFAGLHGPGQKATNQLLCGPPIGQLKKLEKDIEGEPFYQALFHVPLRRDENGEFAPKDIELIAAKSLKPSFA